MFPPYAIYRHFKHKLSLLIFSLAATFTPPWSLVFVGQRSDHGSLARCTDLPRHINLSHLLLMLQFIFNYPTSASPLSHLVTQLSHPSSRELSHQCLIAYFIIYETCDWGGLTKWFLVGTEDSLIWAWSHLTTCSPTSMACHPNL